MRPRRPNLVLCVGFEDEEEITRGSRRARRKLRTHRVGDVGERVGNNYDNLPNYYNYDDTDGSRCHQHVGVCHGDRVDVAPSPTSE